MTILVTGGAGYVGSHAVKELRRNGIPCVVIDSLERGHRELVVGAELVVGDIRDGDLVQRVLGEHQVTAVMHFAAFAYVGESVVNPSIYYQNNVGSTISLLHSLVRCGVKKIVFSSTCSTYGVPEQIPITEEQAQRPVNPYGASKLMVERILKDFDSAYGLKSVVFRYFNAAGADPDGEIGEWHEPETHLIPLVLQTAARLRESVDILGTDYPTPDGTCIRDYIHVVDLARAHVLGLRYLEAGGESDVFNLGNDCGFSVRQVIDAAERLTAQKVKVNNAPRRHGDPPSLVGSSAKARKLLGWAPEFNDLDRIIQTAWRWHSGRGR